jgi:hypothetical protein
MNNTPEMPDCERLREELWALNMLNREAAAYLGVTERTLYSYLSGSTRIPKMLWLALELKQCGFTDKAFLDRQNRIL